MGRALGRSLPYRLIRFGVDTRGSLLRRWTGEMPVYGVTLALFALCTALLASRGIGLDAGPVLANARIYLVSIVAWMALDAGLHLLCEKPLALNVGQASAMLAKAQAAEVVHMILFTYRWSTHHRYLHQLIEEGYIRRPSHGAACLWKYHQEIRPAGIERRFGPLRLAHDRYGPVAFR